jgi:aryl-alcohol dehydrogenase-like predicted oxidoreductase
MRYLTLPGAALEVSAICLGAADMATAIDEPEALRMLDLFRDQGGTFLDTALVYADWVPGGRYVSERLLGRWLRERGRGDTVVATKGGHPPLGAMHQSRLSRAEIAADAENSLRNLGLDTIDLYYLHRDDPERPAEEIVEALFELVRAGKIRHAGCSNWRAPRIRAAQRHAASLGWQGFVADQMLWSLAVVDAAACDPTIAVMDDELRALHAESGMAAVPFSSQANGLFDKLARGTLETLRPAHRRMYAPPENLARFERATRLAAESGLSITQVTLGYLTSQPFATVPVVGPRSVAQLADTLSAADVLLSAAQLRFLETGS